MFSFLSSVFLFVFDTDIVLLGDCVLLLSSLSSSRDRKIFKRQASAFVAQASRRLKKMRIAKIISIIIFLSIYCCKAKSENQILIGFVSDLLYCRLHLLYFIARFNVYYHLSQLVYCLCIYANSSSYGFVLFWTDYSQRVNNSIVNLFKSNEQCSGPTNVE